ncbi:restriction endonuclease subunit S [Enterococcus thailandicus]|uniref:restriction endonuclease subunit S n=1 Tax=Enterococcus thailandicus TaxID=417368 RepID=UPI00244D871B|nr:restriction endonuclease subunit S [Enterococcus thailandicus]GMC02425.1 restriction endonuclease [Enterococcus thailandicus]
MAKIDDSVKKKVPELRFKGFTDDWEERKLGEFSDVRDGTHASPKYVSQGHPMVTSKNLTHSGLDMTDVSFLTDKDFNEINKRSKVSIGDILFGMIGTIGNPVIVDRDDFAIKNVALIKEKTSNPITNKWLLQYLKSPSFNRFIQKENAGGTQKFIALGLIRNMKLRVPEFDEQQKIGAFFKKIDDTIALQQRKLDLLKEQKKGYLQKMFPKNGEKVPELRFAGFADDWEQRKLGEVSERVRGNDGRMDLPTLTISAGKGWLDQRERFSGNIAGKEQKNYTLLSKNELSYNKGNSKLAKYGVVYKLGTYKEALVPRVYHSFRTTRETDPDFIEYMFATKLPDRELGKLVTSGARMDGLLNINYDDFMGIKINIPYLQEQQKIGTFFKQLDDTIALHQRKLDLLKEQKKGFLQKMFV